ncbi:MAG: hypothetical protein NTZ20_05490 [Candidatus Levybacteria bacterium]|nr:hypothetical protein [Candidatus Levybacteria bacterium]
MEKLGEYKYLTKFELTNLNDNCYKATVLRLSKINPKTGLVFTRKIIKQALINYNAKVGKFGHINNYSYQKYDISNVSHIIRELYIIENRLEVIIQIMDTSVGNSLKKLINTFDFYPCLIGKYKKDIHNFITELKIISINIELKNNNAYTI